MVAASDFLTGTRPCIFSWRPADSYQVVAWWDSPIYLQVRCSGSFPVLASASSGDRTRETLQDLRPRPTGTQVQWPRSPPSVPTCPAQARARILLDGPRHATAMRPPEPGGFMKSYLTKDIRNVGIVGHGGTGKTQLVSSLLFTAGMTPRWGKVAEGSAITDFDEEEIARKISTQTGLAYAEYPCTLCAGTNVKINFLDLPGYGTFINETKASLIAADCALIAVDAHVGAQVTTEKDWDFCLEYDIPRAFVLTWMDRDLANFEPSMESLTQSFGRSVVALQLPIGSERGFRGVVDLVAMKA